MDPAVDGIKEAPVAFLGRCGLCTGRRSRNEPGHEPRWLRTCSKLDRLRMHFGARRFVRCRVVCGPCGVLCRQQRPFASGRGDRQWSCSRFMPNCVHAGKKREPDGGHQQAGEQA